MNVSHVGLTKRFEEILFHTNKFVEAGLHEIYGSQQAPARLRPFVMIAFSRFNETHHCCNALYIKYMRYKPRAKSIDLQILHLSSVFSQPMTKELPLECRELASFAICNCYLHGSQEGTLVIYQRTNTLDCQLALYKLFVSLFLNLCLFLPRWNRDSDGYRNQSAYSLNPGRRILQAALLKDYAGSPRHYCNCNQRPGRNGEPSCDLYQLANHARRPIQINCHSLPLQNGLVHGRAA